MSLSIDRYDDEAIDMNHNREDKVNNVFGTKHTLDKHNTFKNNHDENDANPPHSTSLNGT